MRVFKILFKVGFLRLSTYIEASLVNIISAIIYILIQFCVWKAIMANSQSMEYSFMQMFSYIVYSQILMNLYPTSIGKQLGQMIRTGDISFALLRPISLIKQLIFENMGVSFYRTLFISLPIMVIGCIISNFSLCVQNLVLFILSFIMSYIIFLYIDLLFGLLQFYTYSSWGINSLKYAIITLCSGKVLPLSIYPQWSQKILHYLPFKYLYDLPINVIIGQNEMSLGSIILEAGIWIMIIVILFHVIFKEALKNVCIMGG